MEELIRSGADVSHLSREELFGPDANGVTALRLAVKYDRPEVVRMLLGIGVEAMVVRHGSSPIGYAIMRDSRRVAATLFGLGARPMGWTCAEYAIYRDKTALAEWFILQGELPPKSDDTSIGTEQLGELVEWRRQFCACRAVVVAWLGVKRFRGQALAHVDRFLMRHIATAIWQTRWQ